MRGEGAPHGGARLDGEARARGRRARRERVPGRRPHVAAARRREGAHALRRGRRRRGRRATRRSAQSTRQLARLFGYRVREGGVDLDRLDSLGPRLSSLVAAAALQAPYLGTAHHHAGSRAGIGEIAAAFFGDHEEEREPDALVFTDTFDETNGVAGTMRRLAAEGARGCSSRPCGDRARGGFGRAGADRRSRTTGRCRCRPTSSWSCASR